MSAEIIDLFQNKQDKIARTEPLTRAEVDKFKDVLVKSVNDFHKLNPIEKFALYSENVNLIFIMLDLIHGKDDEGN